MISTEDISELKDIYFKLYKRVLNEEEAQELANRLVSLFKVIAKPVPTVDKLKIKNKNGTSNG